MAGCGRLSPGEHTLYIERPFTPLLSRPAFVAMFESLPLDEGAAQRVLSVSELTGFIKEILEASFPSVWVSGEISNFSRPQSGHCYFTLKDDAAQIRAVLWRATANRSRLDLHDGLEVICSGQLDLYAPRGTYQFVVKDIQPKGLGALELRLRRLREKLAAEGLFDRERKRALPSFPCQVAFVTSPTGAAVRDFLEVLRRRWRGVNVLVVPVRVQGDGAAEEIAGAIRMVNRLRRRIDVLIVGRGGGSLEDLWAFNEESVVRAIHGSEIPVISAVGHEIDVTLSDLVADVRALTPSEAAELLAPAAEEVLITLKRQERRLLTALRNRALAGRARLESVAGRRVFRRPFERVQLEARRIDELEARATRAARKRLEQVRQSLEHLGNRLESLSPLAVLGRGYSITQRASDRQVIRNAADLVQGEQIVTRFEAGTVLSEVRKAAI